MNRPCAIHDNLQCPVCPLEQSEREILIQIKSEISSLHGFIKGFTEGLVMRLESIEAELKRKK